MIQGYLFRFFPMGLRFFLGCGLWFSLLGASAQPKCTFLAASSPHDHDSFLLPGRPITGLMAKWGNPDETIGNIYIYRQHGCLVYLSADQTQIMAFVGSWFPGHGGFSQRVLGIGLGTTYPKCLKQLGPPMWRKPLVENVEEAFWTCGGLEIRCEIWTQNDYDPDIGGNIYAETVKRIQMQRAWKP
jgi:hypothetical protein